MAIEEKPGETIEQTDEYKEVLDSQATTVMMQSNDNRNVKSVISQGNLKIGSGQNSIEKQGSNNKGRLDKPSKNVVMGEI